MPGLWVFIAGASVVLVGLYAYGRYLEVHPEKDVRVQRLQRGLEAEAQARLRPVVDEAYRRGVDDALARVRYTQPVESSVRSAAEASRDEFERADGPVVEAWWLAAAGREV